MTEQTAPPAQAAAAASRLPFYAAVGAVAILAAASTGALLWKARHTGPVAAQDAGSAPTVARESVATARADLAPEETAQAPVVPVPTVAVNTPAVAGPVIASPLDQAMAPVAAAAGPFGAWFQPATWAAFLNTATGMVTHGMDPRTYASAFQTYANPATYVQGALRVMGQVQPQSVAVPPAAH